MKSFKIYTPDTNELYLKRLRVIQTPWFAFYVHWIYLPDSDRDMHDHPWNFWSFVVRGGYTEVVRNHWWSPEEIKTHGAWSLHKMSKHSAHKISLLQRNTITAIFTGRRTREWGFWTEDGFVQWDHYDRAGGPDPFDS